MCWCLKKWKIPVQYWERHFFGSGEAVSEKYGIIFLGGMAETV